MYIPKPDRSMEMGIVGNCNFSALIDRHANVNFMCWPRFDSDFTFASLLDEERGGCFRIGPTQASKGEQKYLSNSNILSTTFNTSSGSFEVIDFAPRYVRNDRYFKPIMLVRMVRILSGEPLINVDIRPVFNRSSEFSKPAIRSNHIKFHGGEHTVRLYSNASLSMILEGRSISSDQNLYFMLTCDARLESQLQETCEEHFERTRAYWQRWVKHCVLPREYQNEVIRSALVLKLHQFEDTGAMIAATTTSIPEADQTVRNWDYRYCWLRDAQMMVWTLHKINHFEELEEFINFLRFITRNELDEIQPVYGISGERNLIEKTLPHLSGYCGNRPVRIGNAAYIQPQHDIYGGLIVALSPLYLDIRFRKSEQPLNTQMIHRLLERIETYFDTPDAGLWEYRQERRVHTYTILQHWKGASKAMEIGKFYNESALFIRAKNLADRSMKYLMEKGWNNERGFFSQEAGGAFADASLLMIINLGALDYADPKARLHVEHYVNVLQTKNGFLRRYVKNDDFGETENAFIICSFWLVEAYARIGEIIRAQKLMEQLLKVSNHLGLYSEDYDPSNEELWGNFPQTYSHVGVIRAAFALSPPWFD